MSNILLVGAGQLGSRHLQALALLTIEVNIFVVDPSSESLMIAKQRFDEIADSFNVNITYSQDINDIPGVIDIAIVATSSKVRRKVIEAIISKSQVKYFVLEKVLFTRSDDYEIVSELLIRNNISAWVNCPRRMNQYYKNLSSKLNGNISLNAIGNGWGLGCNVIHLLDLFAFLSRNSNCIVDTQNLIPEIFESKRAGYIELGGTIAAYTDGGDTFSATCYMNGVSPLTLFISAENARYVISEGSTARVWKSESENNWVWEEENFTIDFQSKLTNRFVEQLLLEGNCELTTYEESAKLHLAFINAIIPFQEKLQNKKIQECSIT